MIKTISKSIALLTALMIVAFTLHYLFVAEIEKSALQKLLLTYLFNYLFTLALVYVFNILIRRQSKQIGYAFLFGSMIKFILFFAFISPFLKMNGSVKSFAFAAFFIPYAICLIAEVWITARILNDSEQKQ